MILAVLYIDTVIFANNMTKKVFSKKSHKLVDKLLYYK